MVRSLRWRERMPWRSNVLIFELFPLFVMIAAGAIGVMLFVMNRSGDD